MAEPRKAPAENLARWLRLPFGWFALTVFCIGSLIAIGLAQRQASQNTRIADQAMAAQTRWLTSILPLEIQSYEKGVRGARGAVLVGGQEKISRATFLTYIQSRDIETEFPASSGFGFVRRVANQDLDVVEFLEPSNGEPAARGIDIASSEPARAAARTALLSGQATLTAPIAASDTSRETVGGQWLLLLPVYRPGLPLLSERDRELACIGWTYSELRIHDLLAGSTRQFSTLAMEFSDASAGIFFATQRIDAGFRPDLRRRVSVSVYGREWNIDIAATPEFIAALHPTSPQRLAVTGTVFAALFSALLLSLHTLAKRRGELQRQARRLRRIRIVRAIAARKRANAQLRLVNGQLEGRVLERTAELGETVRSLRASERFLSRVSHLAGVGGWLLDLEDGSVIWSTETYRLHDVSADYQPTVEDALAFYTPGSLPLIRRAIAECTATGAPWDLELELVSARGNPLWARVTGTAEFENDRVVRLVGAFQDISARKHTERRLLELSSLLALVLDSSSEVSIIATDPCLGITVFNAGAERLLGYTRDEMVGRVTTAVFHDADEMRQRSAALLAQTGEPVEGAAVFTHPATLRQPREWTYIRKTGERVRVSLVVTPMHGGDGSIIGYLGVAHDITRQHQYEESLRQLTRHAETANRAKSEFLANMSHEIRTPLNAVIGLGYLLEQTALGPDQRQLLAKIQFAGRSLLGVVNNVLDLSKIEAGEMALDTAPFELPEMVLAVNEMLAPQAVAKGIRIQSTTPTTLPTRVLGDESRLRQILVNLISNSIKFTESGGVNVTVSAVDHNADRFRLRCEVTDTGIGIRADTLDRLFSPFTQADASTTRRFGGTGLGLSIARRLVEMMGGEIGVSSTLGVGSTFWFEVPLAIVHEGEATQCLRHLNQLRIMVVEPQTSAPGALCAMIRALGWDPELAATGHDILTGLQDDRQSGFDVVITPSSLKDMTVNELIDRMRTLYTGEEPPSLIVIADSMQTQPLHDFKLRSTDLLLRHPVASSSLFNAVNAVVSRRKGGHERLMETTNFDTLSVHWLSGVRMLVADDSDINLEVARRILERQGAIVSTCADGRAAVEHVLMNRDAVDVVLMDVQMPVLDGNAAAQRIRQEPGLATLPIVALTAGALVGERQRALDAGMNDVVTKPFDPTTLVRKIRRLVERAHNSSLPVVMPESRSASIDGHAVKRTFGHDQTLFQKLITRMLHDFADFAVPLQEAPSDATAMAALRHRLHKLKGTAGMVGARHVAHAAGVAEDTLRNHGSAHDLDTILKQLAVALTEIAEDAARSGPTTLAPETGQGGIALSGEAAIAALESTIHLLDEHNVLAHDQFKAASAWMTTLLGATRVEDIGRAIDDLDFELAAKLMSESLHRLQSTAPAIAL